MEKDYENVDKSTQVTYRNPLEINTSLPNHNSTITSNNAHTFADCKTLTTKQAESQIFSFLFLSYNRSFNGVYILQVNYKRFDKLYSVLHKQKQATHYNDELFIKEW